MGKSILLIDSRLTELETLSRIFQKAGYGVTAEGNGRSALDILAKQSADLVIMDIEMPGADGFGQLSKIKLLYPQTLRVIISDNPEEAKIYKALEQNLARLVIQRSWPERKMLDTVEQIFTTGETLKSSNLLRQMNNLETLPTIGANYQKIIGLVDNDGEIRDIAGEIEKDQSIALKVLHIANSAYYGVNTGSVGQAILYLGLNNLRNIILSISIMDLFKSDAANMDTISKMWEHANISNRLIQYIYEKMLFQKLPDICQTAGLLHNVGEIYFLKFYGRLFMEAVRQSKSERADRVKLETDLLGISHCEAGACLLEWWELPFPIVETALYHHHPLSGRIVNKQLVCAAHISDKYVCEILGEGDSDNFYEDSYYVLNLSKTEFERKLVQFTPK